MHAWDVIDLPKAVADARPLCDAKCRAMAGVGKVTARKGALLQQRIQTRLALFPVGPRLGWGGPVTKT